MGLPDDILLIPLVARGYGTGHARRMLSLASGFGSRARILLDGEDARGQFLKLCTGGNCPAIITGTEAERIDWDLVIVDRRETDRETVTRYSRTGRIVGIDEGGTRRPFFAYLIDILPFPAETCANVTDPGFLDLPETVRTVPEKIRNVLLSFGGEDPASLTVPCAKAVLETGFFSPGDVTVVKGPLSRTGLADGLPDGVRILEAPSNLKERLHEYDLVVTSFGITAFEAASAGVPVILCNPTAHHTRLSEYSGFPTIGHGAPDASALKRFLSRPGFLKDFVRTANVRRREPLHEFLSKFDFSSGTFCPSCRHVGNASVHREERRTFFRCASCGLLFQKDYSTERVVYGRDYFFEEYRAQYGKTYLDDFSSIRAAGVIRSRSIAKLLAVSGDGRERSILDIGCAYGPFLDAARETGFVPYGLDVSEDAAEYVENTLGISARAASFPSCSPRELFGVDKFSAVTMWYVIEHFVDLASVLSTVRELLPVGGVFAFSTPNASGISARKNFKGFLSGSPRDHFTLWEPGRTAKLLGKYGFRLKKIRITGHHPERFPAAGAYAAGTGRFSKALSRLLLGASRLFGLGDTFEAYAVRIR